MSMSLTKMSIGAGVEPPSVARLSGLESRCLLRRLDDCERTLRAALLGIQEARDKTHDASELVDINDELAQAKSHLIQAHNVATIATISQRSQ